GLEKDRREPISVIIADLNGLKKANDQLGHQAGDSLIRRAAEVYKASFEEEILIARIGGDEFVIILPGADERIPTEAMDRLESLTALNNKYYREPELSISLAAATSRPELSVEKLISLADDAMYKHKGQHYGRRREDQ